VSAMSVTAKMQCGLSTYLVPVMLLALLVALLRFLSFAFAASNLQSLRRQRDGSRMVRLLGRLG
jgi:hypothetical protein